MKSLKKNKQIVLIVLILTLGFCNQLIAQKSYLLNLGEIDSLYSEELKESREFYVILPDSYYPETVKKYPVVYLLDGEVLLNAVATVQNFYWGGFIPEMIIVGIANNKNRTRDLTTSTINFRYGSEYNEENGGAEKFTSFIEKELIPYVESNYPVTNYRTLIGHSFGGLFAVNTYLKHSHLFSNYLAIDPSLDWDDQKLIKQSGKLLKKNNYERKMIYLTMSGQLHMQDNTITIENVMDDTSEYTLFPRSIIQFANMLQSKGLNSFLNFYPDEIHGSVALLSIIDGMKYIFSWYPIENVEIFNSPETPKEALILHIRNRENKLKNHFGYSVPPFDEELLNMLGYMNLEWGNDSTTLEIFKLIIEYYPMSANAYDSLADYYVSQNDFANALKNVKKAYDISGSDYYLERISEFKKKIIPSSP